MKTYVVVYWRNDGEYHSDFEYTPHYTFKARDDTQATSIATEIGRKETRRWSDFFFNRLVEVSLRGIVEKDRREVRLEERVVQVDEEQMREDLRQAKYDHTARQYERELQKISYEKLIRDFLSTPHKKKSLEKRLL